VKIGLDSTPRHLFQEAQFRNDLSQFGDSLLVVADVDLVKVHIHAEYPGQVMDYAMKYGELTKIKIENMREQHSHILMSEESLSQAIIVEKTYGFIAVGIGDGINAIFNSLGVDIVLKGGQTMNPSTEDIVQAAKNIAAKTVFILPNNSNIILAAQQAKELLSEQKLIIIPSKSIPQGLAAIVAFNETDEPDANTDKMLSALTHVQSGQVTYAVRDTEMDEIIIKKHDFIGMLNNQIIVAHADLLMTCKELMTRMLDNQGDIVTLFTGQDATNEVTQELVSFIKQSYPEVEIEVHPGGQPLYPFLISVE
jgi:DAK2 domain fusion protein YloV